MGPFFSFPRPKHLPSNFFTFSVFLSPPPSLLLSLACLREEEEEEGYWKEEEGCRPGRASRGGEEGTRKGRLAAHAGMAVFLSRLP